MLKKFLSYYKKYIGLFILDMSAAVVIAVCNLFYPTVVKDIINKYVYNETPKMLIIWSAVLLGIYLLKAACTFIVSYHGHIMGVRMQKDMRADLFRKYQSLPVKFYDNNKTGDLLTRLVNDLFEVSELAHHGPENLFLAVLMFTGAFCMLITINVQLTLIVIAIIPFIVVFTNLSRAEMKTALKAYRKQTAAINSTLENSLSGIRETKLYTRGEGEIEKFSKVNGLFASLRSRAMLSLGKYETVMAFISDLLYLVIVFAGGLFFFYKKIDAGEFAAFILYISMFLTPIHKFSTLFEQFQEGMTGFSRFYEIMEMNNEEDIGTHEPESVAGDIEFKNVSFSYDECDEKRVINDLSLHIKPGETLALVGPSGGGKTTLCNLLPRLYNVTGGTITLDGTDIMDIKLSSLRRHIGVVSQNVFLFDGTIRDNIAYGKADATEEEIISAAKRANIHEYISTLECGYDTEVGERGIKLSGGQRQRVAIARLFLKNPSLLILDEATSALDNVTEMQIQRSLEELSLGRTVIVVAHRLSTVKNADRIVVIDNTGIVESGTHDELIELNGTYARLYTASLIGGTDPNSPGTIIATGENI
ncbi:MAG: ABC transporter ATP-binding protein [Clostridia bacterium]|nr:ABC transporter ATP-binding protein [Clostridia bacterium]